MWFHEKKTLFYIQVNLVICMLTECCQFIYYIFFIYTQDKCKRFAKKTVSQFLGSKQIFCKTKIKALQMIKKILLHYVYINSNNDAVSCYLKNSNFTPSLRNRMQRFSIEAFLLINKFCYWNLWYCLIFFPGLEMFNWYHQVFPPVLKGIVHPKMEINQCFSYPQTIVGVYDFLLSDG